MEGTVTRTSTLSSYEVEYDSDPEITLYWDEDDDGEHVIISILRDMENRGKDSLRVKLPRLHFEELISKANRVLDPAPPPASRFYGPEAIRQAERQARYAHAQPIRTGPKPEPSAHDLIMQMEGHDVDDDIQPDESWLDEWPDEAAISKPRPNPYDMPL
jgi:hypothetical protein